MPRVRRNLGRTRPCARTRARNHTRCAHDKELGRHRLGAERAGVAVDEGRRSKRGDNGQLGKVGKARGTCVELQHGKGRQRRGDGNDAASVANVGDGRDVAGRHVWGARSSGG